MAVVGVVTFILGILLGTQIQTRLPEVIKIPVHVGKPQPFKPPPIRVLKDTPIELQERTVQVLKPTPKQKKKVESKFNLDLDKVDLVGSFEVPPSESGYKGTTTITKEGQIESVLVQEPAPLVRYNPSSSLAVAWYRQRTTYESGFGVHEVRFEFDPLDFKRKGDPIVLGLDLDLEDSERSEILLLSRWNF